MTRVNGIIKRNKNVYQRKVFSGSPRGSEKFSVTLEDANLSDMTSENEENTGKFRNFTLIRINLFFYQD